MARLRGPKAVPPAVVIPDLGLSAAKAADLDLQLDQLLYRWQPKTEHPESVRRELYALLAWVLDGDRPPHRLLVDP